MNNFKVMHIYPLPMVDRYVVEFKFLDNLYDVEVDGMDINNYSFLEKRIMKYHHDYEAMSKKKREQIALAIRMFGESKCYKVWAFREVSCVALCHPKLREIRLKKWHNQSAHIKTVLSKDPYDFDS